MIFTEVIDRIGEAFRLPLDATILSAVGTFLTYESATKGEWVPSEAPRYPDFMCVVAVPPHASNLAFAESNHPYAQSRLQIEDMVRQTIDSWPEHVQATAYHYLHALDWRIDKARAVRRRAFGDD